jgi:TPR repeat protein
MFVFCVSLSGTNDDSWVYELKPSDFNKTKVLAEKGDLDAQHKLGVMYVRGVGVKKDAKTGYDWYRMAASKGHIDSQYTVGDLAELEGDYELALKWFSEAANQGHLRAQVHLGSSYTGRGGTFPIDYKLAIKWYTKAAVQGDRLACWELAQIFDGTLSLGGKWIHPLSDENPLKRYIDYKKAFLNYKKAAFLGNKFCQRKVGSMYESGIGITADFVKAYAWISVAKANGNEAAWSSLADLTQKMSKDQIAVGQVLAGELFEEIKNNQSDNPVNQRFD